MKKALAKTVTEIDASAAGVLLGLTAGWLAQLRVKGEGPPWHKRGTRVIYIKEEVEAWKLANTTGGDNLLVVELKTLTVRKREDGNRYVTINGKEYRVEPHTAALLATPKNGGTK